MRTGPRILMGLLLALAGAPVVPAAQAQQRKTLLDYLVQMQSDMMAPIIDHCARAVPAIRVDLDREFGAFKEKLKLATQPLMRRLDQAGLPEPSSEEASQMQQMIRALAAAQLDEVRKQDPAMYCPSLVMKVRSVTVDALRAGIEATYDQYSGAAAAEAGKGSAR